MKAAKVPALPVSDHEFVRKILDRVARIEQSRRLMPNESRLIDAVRERWTSDGKAFAMAPAHRENLVSLVGKIETRVKTLPYPRFF